MVTITLEFDSESDRDEFLREHIDRPCSDIDAGVRLVGPDPRNTT